MKYKLQKKESLALSSLVIRDEKELYEYIELLVSIEKLRSQNDGLRISREIFCVNN